MRFLANFFKMYKCHVVLCIYTLYTALLQAMGINAATTWPQFSASLPLLSIAAIQIYDSVYISHFQYAMCSTHLGLLLGFFFFLKADSLFCVLLVRWPSSSSVRDSRIRPTTAFFFDFRFGS
jgi:hypothetical protein